MKLLPHLLFLLVILHSSFAPPVSPDKQKESEIKDDLDEYMEYHRYLKEVVQALESDPDFRERLEKADEDEVRSGKIAEHLDFVNHNVRTKLDEIKRRELDRLRHLATKQYELTNNLDVHGKVPTNEHLDHANPHTFEIEDLKRLIRKTTEDLQAADKKREQEFKEYEMHKEFEKHQKLESLDETQKKEYLDKLKKEEEAKKHHKPLHHPGSKPQLEEVWEKQDHMDQQFDPKVFFMMHDVDGNGAWDADEVKALFIKELDKMYGPGGPNKDMHERAEEMERMREHVFQENDINKDGLIDFNEFMKKTQNSDFNQDDGWKSIDENQIYTQAEYQEYERRQMEELRYLQERGLIDAHGQPVPGAQHQLHQYQLQKQQAYQQQQQAYQQYPSQHYPQGQVPPQGYQQVPGQVPQQGYQPPMSGPNSHQGYQQPPQGQFQGQPQAQYQGQQVQHQGQPQAQYQGQPQAQYQGQPQAQYQGQPQAQFQGQPQQAQYQAPPQNQNNVNQGQAAPAQPAVQAHVPAQGQPPQGQVPPAQNQQVPQNQPAQPVQAQQSPPAPAVAH